MNAVFWVAISVVFSVIDLYRCFVAEFLAAHILYIELNGSFADIGFLPFKFEKSLGTLLYQILQRIFFILISKASVNGFVTDKGVFI